MFLHRSAQPSPRNIHLRGRLRDQRSTRVGGGCVRGQGGGHGGSLWCATIRFVDGSCAHHFQLRRRTPDLVVVGTRPHRWLVHFGVWLAGHGLCCFAHQLFRGANRSTGCCAQAVTSSLSTAPPVHQNHHREAHHKANTYKTDSHEEMCGDTTTVITRPLAALAKA